MKIGTFIRETQAQYPIGSRSPEAMRQLWDATMRAWEAIADRFPDTDPENLIAGYAQVLTDRDGFLARMDAYDAEIRDATSEEELTGPVVRGLLLNFPGSGHTVPDFAMPHTLANQIDVLDDMGEVLWDGFKRDVKDAAKDIGKGAGFGLGTILVVAAGAAWVGSFFGGDRS